MGESVALDKELVDDVFRKLDNGNIQELESKDGAELRNSNATDADFYCNYKVSELDQSTKKLKQKLEEVRDALGEIRTSVKSSLSSLNDRQNDITNLGKDAKRAKTSANAVRDVIELVNVDKDIIYYLLSEECNENLVNYLLNLDDRLECMKSCPGESFPALENSMKLTKLLMDGLVERAYEMILSSLDLLRNPSSNISVIQTSIFLKYQSLFKLLQKRYPSIVEEFISFYKEITSSYYNFNFQKYYDSLEHIMIRGEHLTSSFKGETHLSSRLSKFFSITKSSDWSLISKTHVIVPLIERQNENSTYPEILLRSLLVVLVDNITSEFFFQTILFDFSHDPDKFKDIFLGTFSDTLSFVKGKIKSLLDLDTGRKDLIILILFITILNQCIDTINKNNIWVCKDFFEKIKEELLEVYGIIIRMKTEKISSSIKEKVSSSNVFKISKEFTKIIVFTLTVGRECFHDANDAGLGDIKDEFFDFIDNITGGSNTEFLQISSFYYIQSRLNDYHFESFQVEKNDIEIRLKKYIQKYAISQLKDKFPTLIDAHYSLDNIQLLKDECHISMAEYLNELLSRIRVTFNLEALAILLFEEIIETLSQILITARESKLCDNDLSKTLQDASIQLKNSANEILSGIKKP